MDGESLINLIAIICTLAHAAVSLACLRNTLTQLIIRRRISANNLVNEILKSNWNKEKKRRAKKLVRYWIRPGRSSLWWDNFANGRVVQEEWIENFRMTKESFIILCQELGPYIRKRATK